MIHKIEFDNLPEWRKKISKPMDLMFNLHQYNSQDSILLYRNTLNKKYETFNKRGVSLSNLSKLKLDEITQNTIFIFQISIIEDFGSEGIKLLRNLIEHCIRNNKDLYIPTTSRLNYINSVIDEYKHISIDTDALQRDFLINSILK